MVSSRSGSESGRGCSSVADWFTSGKLFSKGVVGVIGDSVGKEFDGEGVEEEVDGVAVIVDEVEPVAEAELGHLLFGG